MKIAFTTHDSEYINAHFGSASRIDVYDVNTDGYTFVEQLCFDGNLKEDGNEDKVEPKLAALHDCTIIYVAAIGGSVAARLIHRNITPIKAETDQDRIEDILVRLVQTLKGNPPPWLRKALKGNKPTTFDDAFETTEEEMRV
jgi:nitrogen fixation protein NifX